MLKLFAGATTLLRAESKDSNETIVTVASAVVAASQEEAVGLAVFAAQDECSPSDGWAILTVQMNEIDRDFVETAYHELPLELEDDEDDDVHKLIETAA